MDTTQKTTQKTTKEIILELLKINNKMTREDLAKQIGVSRDTIKYHITNLQTENRLQRVGGRKEGYWEVLKDNTTI
ncbi:MAG: HTH domain-containing protein [Arcobacteraceae bacterium]